MEIYLNQKQSHIRMVASGQFVVCSHLLLPQIAVCFEPGFELKYEYINSSSLCLMSTPLPVPHVIPDICTAGVLQTHFGLWTGLLPGFTVKNALPPNLPGVNTHPLGFH